MIDHTIDENGAPHPVPDEQPTMRCPRCGVEEPDFDGFGMVAHTKPAFKRGCGYCSHPSRTKDPEGWRCGICGDVRSDCLACGGDGKTAPAEPQMCPGCGGSGSELDRLRAEVERLNKALAERPTWPERAAMLAKIEAAEDLAGEWKAEADKYLDNIENRGRELTRVVARCLARIASKRAADMMAARKRAQAQAAADAQAEAERAKLAAQAAANAAALDRPATTTAGAGGRGAARRRWVAEVTDAAAVPRAYCLPDEKRIGREVRAGTLRELPGVRIYEVEDLAVSDS